MLTARHPVDLPSIEAKQMADHILLFPLLSRGDPEPRRMVLASVGFEWRAGLWRRGCVVLSKADIEAMDVRTWAQCLGRWTTRRPRAHASRAVPSRRSLRGPNTVRHKICGRFHG